MPTLIISLSDVVTLDLYTELTKSHGDDALQQCLWSMGMDTNRHIEESFVEHRSEITGLVVTCPRYVGQERSDSKWKFTKLRAMGVLI